jgi:hypothetical protein
MKISIILDSIDLGSMALPEFQRGYVWNREQVRGLMHSLYHRHPVGSLLVWETKTESAKARGDGQLASGTVKLLLDGQQRITSLYGIVRGRPPRFFDGNAQTFSGLYFHLDDEVFEFYAPMKMKDNPLWINVSELMKQGLAEYMQRLIAQPDLAPQVGGYINRLNAVEGIKSVDLHIEVVTGEDKTVDVVVDIFNRVNSGGTKLSQGDLALAKICAQWPEARQEMKTRLDKWRQAGFDFRLEWLLRNVNAIVTGEAKFSALRDVETAEFQNGLQQAENAIDRLLNTIAGRLGLDHGRVLGGPGCFPLMSRYLIQRGGHFADAAERDRLLYWYVHSFLWGRYAGSTESVLNQDLACIENLDGAIDRLIEMLRKNRGDLELKPTDFSGWSRGTRFYPLLYLMTRVCHAQDWCSGVELSSHLLGQLSRLELHHVFPKAKLYEHGYSRSQVNAIANFTFQTKETNLAISDRNPAEYLEKVDRKYSGALESHWIPADPKLWQYEHYEEFLEERRKLLGRAANTFLDSLVAGHVPEVEAEVSVLEWPEEAAVPGGVADEDEERTIRECNDWVVEQGLPAGEYMYELMHEGTGSLLAVLDLAWPRGMQEGLSQPVALLIDEEEETGKIAGAAGYRFFTDVESFRKYVEKEILALESVDT